MKFEMSFKNSSNVVATDSIIGGVGIALTGNRYFNFCLLLDFLFNILFSSYLKWFFVSLLYSILYLLSIYST